MIGVRWILSTVVGTGVEEVRSVIVMPLFVKQPWRCRGVFQVNKVIGEDEWGSRVMERVGGEGSLKLWREGMTERVSSMCGGVDVD